MKKAIIAAAIIVVAFAGITAYVLINKKDNQKATGQTTSADSGDKNSVGGSNTQNSGTNSNSAASNPNGNSATTPQSGTATSPAATDAVTITDYAFTAKTITVKKGSAVTWTNKGAVQHTITGDSDNTIHSQPLNTGDTYTYTFSATGTYAYHCSFHAGMTGTVIVTE